MSCFNVMGTACCKFFCYCKTGVFSFIADGLHTVLCSLDIFFHNRSVFKRLFRSLCDGSFQVFLGINLCNGSASGTVCGLYNNREFLRNYSVSHRYCLKKGNRDSGLLKSIPHGKLVGGIFNTCAAVSRKPKLLCQILHCNICQVRTYGCNCIRLYFTADLKNLLFFRNTDLIKKIRIPGSCSAFSPGKHMSFISHFSGFLY